MSGDSEVVDDEYEPHLGCWCCGRERPSVAEYGERCWMCSETCFGLTGCEELRRNRR